MRNLKKIFMAIFRLALLFSPGILTAVASTKSNGIWVALLAAFGIETLVVMFVAFVYLMGEAWRKERESNSQEGTEAEK